MPKTRGGSGRQDGRTGRWAFFVTVFTLVTTVLLGLLSNHLFKIIPIGGALAIQVLLVAAGVFCDLVGIAVATASMPPFLAMASRKVAGADKSIWLIKNAERVTNLFNDVLGDIFGVLSGATGATIVLMIIANNTLLSKYETYAGIAMSALIAALLVGGKSAGKAFAMRNSREIVLVMGRILNFFSPPQRGKPGRKSN